MKTISKYILLSIIMITLFINIKVNASEIKLNNSTGLYVWNITDTDYSGFKRLIDYLDIDTIYLGCYSNFYDYKFNLYFQFAKENSLKTFIAYGEREDEWYEDGNDGLIKHFKKIIDRVDELNKVNEYQISGIAIDSEFHSLSSYKAIKDIPEKKEEFFRKYVDAIKEAYEYSKSKGLEFVACIPWNYDSISTSLLEELIADGCDYVQIMNYTKKNTIRNIETEISLAKKYNKKIESIAELQRPGEHGIEDIITFWNDGIDASTENFKAMEEHYKYENLFFTYHQLLPMLELLNNISDFTDLYDYKVTAKYQDKNIELNDIYLVNNEEKIKGLKVYNPTSNEYVLYFYGLSFDKEYTFIDESKKYSIEDNKIINNKSSSRILTHNISIIDYIEEEPDVTDPIPDEPDTPEEPEEPDIPDDKDDTPDLVPTPSDDIPYNPVKNPNTNDSILKIMLLFFISLITIIYSNIKMKSLVK